MKEYIDLVKYVLATNSGTSSLFLALKIAGVKKNHEVIVPTITFIAPINAVSYNGAIPIFMDSDDSLNFEQDKILIKSHDNIQFGNNIIIDSETYTLNIDPGHHNDAAINISGSDGNLVQVSSSGMSIHSGGSRVAGFSSEGLILGDVTKAHISSSTIDVNILEESNN